MFLVADFILGILKSVLNLVFWIAMKIHNLRVILELVQRSEAMNAQIEGLSGQKQSHGENSFLLLTDLQAVEQRVQDVEKRLARVEAHMRGATDGETMSESTVCLQTLDHAPLGRSYENRAEGGSPEEHSGKEYMEEDGQLHTGVEESEVRNWS
jgi:hypothetical protein